MDIDQVYPPDYFQKIVPLLDEYKVMAPLIYDRWPQNHFMPLVFDDVDIDKFTLKLMDLRGKTGIIEVPYCHANLFMTREVMEKLPSPPYPGGLRPDGLQKIQHADFILNESIRNAGYKIYVNLDVVVEHITEIPVSNEFFVRWNQPKPKL